MNPRVVAEHPNHAVGAISEMDARHPTELIKTDPVGFSVRARDHLQRPKPDPVEILTLGEQLELMRLVSMPQAHEGACEEINEART